MEDLFLGSQWSIILGYRRLSVKFPEFVGDEFYFLWTSILSQLMIEDLSGKNLLTLFPISSRQQSARHPLGLAVGGWRKDIICLWKVDRVLANHSLSSTASQGTSNIPVSWFLLLGCYRQAQTKS